MGGGRPALTNFLIIVVSLAAGYLLRRAGRVPLGAPQALNAWILTVAMPAVVLQVVPRIVWSPEALAPLLAPVVEFAGAAAWVALGARRGGWDRAQRSALTLGAGLANTSFVGFPLILAWYGPADLGPALLADQMSFLLLATAGVAWAATAGSPGPGVGRLVVRRIVTFPPLLVLPLAFLWPMGWGRESLDPLFGALAATLAPLALFSVGVQMSFREARTGGSAVAWALVYRLAVAPALVLGLVLAAGLHGAGARIAVFEAAMAPMITTAVVAAEFGAAPRLATALVAMGIPLSLVTTAGWWWVLNSVGLGMGATG